MPDFLKNKWWRLQKGSRKRLRWIHKKSSCTFLSFSTQKYFPVSTSSFYTTHILISNFSFNLFTASPNILPQILLFMNTCFSSCFTSASACLCNFLTACICLTVFVRFSTTTKCFPPFSMNYSHLKFWFILTTPSNFPLQLQHFFLCEWSSCTYKAKIL